MYLLLDDVKGSVVLGEKEDVSGLALLLDGFSDEGLRWHELSIFSSGKRGKENVGGFEVAEISSKVSLNCVRDLLTGWGCLKERSNK